MNNGITAFQKNIIAALIADGLTIGDMIEQYAERQDGLQKELCERAEAPCDGVEIDALTITSAENAEEIVANEGSYVLAWVWVPHGDSDDD